MIASAGSNRNGRLPTAADWGCPGVAQSRRRLSPALHAKDRMHLYDLIRVGLIGEENLSGLPPALANRLGELLENPEG